MAPSLNLIFQFCLTCISKYRRSRRSIMFCWRSYERIKRGLGLRRGFLLGGSLIFGYDNDYDVTVSKKESEIDYDESFHTLSPVERLEYFLVTPGGPNNPEKQFVEDLVLLSTLAGFVMGGGRRAMDNVHLYRARHRNEMFLDPREAQRRMNDHFLLGFIRGGIRYGFKLGLTTGIFMGVSTLLMVYRNYVNPLDHVAAGSILGFGLRFWTGGLKGGIAGGVLGSGFGLVSGISTKGVEWLNGTTTEERYRNYSKVLAYEKEQKDIRHKELVQKYARDETNVWTDDVGKEEEEDDDPDKKFDRSDGYVVPLVRKAIIFLRDYNR